MAPKNIFPFIGQYAQGGIPYFAQLICGPGPGFPVLKDRWELSRREGTIDSFGYMIGAKKSVKTMLSVICLLIVLLLMPLALFAPFIQPLFTTDELAEMGVHIGA